MRLSTVKTYYRLTKPGIIYGNALAALGGFLLAAMGDIDITALVGMLMGTSLVIGSACVQNNYIDRNIDAVMSRTKKRAISSGAVSHKAAIIYALALAVTGFAILAITTNLLTVLIGLTGMVFYVVVYGVAKRRTTYGTLVGAISGALPPVGGYTAASGTLDLGAILLFAILFVWQMPHFYSIAIFRLNDYKAAKIPVLPAIKGIRRTKFEITCYIVLFIAVSWLLVIFDYTGYVYAVVMTLLGVRWLKLSIRSLHSNENDKYARKSFKFSLLVLLAFSLLISLESLLP